MKVCNDTGAVIIGRNEGERLKRCLRSIVGLVEPVVYVDSGSSDGSVFFARSIGIAVVELDMSRPFTAARARNEGMRRLRELKPSTQFVQFVDGDCQVQDGWLELARNALLKSKEIAVVCGRRREIAPDASIYNLLCDVEWDTPVGKASSCGGDAMMRIQALEDVDGYNDSIIAGEEPELCFRFRESGWQVWRLDAEMTLHDAAITRFSQWWRRAMRAGHAFAQGAWMHGRSPERFNVRSLMRIFVWGGIFPLTVLVLSQITSPLWMLALSAYSVPAWRTRRSQIQHGRSVREANVYAFFTILDKFPALFGALRFFLGKFTDNASAIMEYKGR